MLRWIVGENMSIQDPISDMITVIRNGLKAHKKTVTSPYSKFKISILAILVEEGFIKSFNIQEIRKNVKSIEVVLKYYAGEPIIQSIKRVSKPSLRKYFPANEIPLVLDGMGVSVVSTNQGVMTDFNARQKGIGGEVLFEVE